jgi:hypothetical protein
MANRYARQPHPRSDDDDEEDLPVPSVQPLIAERHLVSLKPLGRPYKSDEEKLEVFTQLVRLKENRKTNKECADLLSVSERTIVNYLADPFYTDVQTTLIAEAKVRGHLQISDVIDAAVNKLYGLMDTARSEFVQYKSAEYLLKMAGYENMVEERARDNQADVIEFLSKLQQGKHPKVQVNVQINQSSSGETFVDANPSLADELAQYQVPMLPGGKLAPLDD